MHLSNTIEVLCLNPTLHQKKLELRLQSFQKSCLILKSSNLEELKIYPLKRELYLFIIGFLVSCLVIASVFLVNKEEKDKYKDSDKANEMDYDGMGNYGRFPQKN